MMKRLLICAAVLAAGIGFTAVDPGTAHADPTCTFLGQNYDVQYNCLNPPPGIAGGYGTANNPPLGGSGVMPGGNGPTINGVEPGWSGPNCPACSS